MNNATHDAWMDETPREIGMEALLQDLRSLGLGHIAVPRGFPAALRSDARLTRDHAEWLVRANTAVAAVRGAESGVAWADSFASAVARAVTEDPESPGAVDLSEAGWLLSAMGWASPPDHASLAAMVHIHCAATRVPDSFRLATAEAIRARVRWDGCVGDRSLDLLNRFVYGPGGYDGVRASAEEAWMLFDINAETAHRDDHSLGWKNFFTGALKWHLLHDPLSPGKIDDAEAGWLAERLRALPALDGNTRALLEEVREHARLAPGYILRSPDSLFAMLH